MKKYEIIFWIIKVPLDFLTIILSFFIAKKIRLVTDLIPNVQLPIKTIDDKSLILYATVAWLFYIFIFASHKLYSTKITNSKIKEAIDIIRYWAYSFIFFSVLVYLTKWFIWKITEIPRLIIIFSFFISSFLVILERILLNKIEYFLLEKNILPKKNLLLINNKKNISDIVKDIKNAKIYDIFWYTNKKSIKDKKIKFYDFKKTLKLLKNKKIDEILYIDSDFDKEELYEIWDYSRIFWIRYRYITNSFDITKLNTELWLINKIPVLEIKNTPINSIWAKFFKRIFDIFGSIIWIIIFSPIMIITAILIKLEDPKWPIIYKNRRIWQNWKIFNLYKFRYLKWEYCIKDSYWVKPKNDKALEFEKKLISEKSIRKGPLYKIENDPRKTKIWSFIEKYSIDELPQFFNTLIWNMSLVWPRPHQPREVKNYELYQKRVLTIKPWITWMAQVNWREKNDFKKEVELDIFYIENRTFILDLKILLKTFTTILKR